MLRRLGAQSGSCRRSGFEADELDRECENVYEGSTFFLVLAGAYITLLMICTGTHIIATHHVLRMSVSMSKGQTVCWINGLFGQSCCVNKTKFGGFTVGRQYPTFTYAWEYVSFTEVVDHNAKLPKREVSLLADCG